jgi:hypothetical protein
MPEPPVVYYYGCYPNSRDTYLSIANGGAGQSGFIGRWADAFIDYSVQAGSKPFRVRNCVLPRSWYFDVDLDRLAFG